MSLAVSIIAACFVTGCLILALQIASDRRRTREENLRRLDRVIEDNRPRFLQMGFDVKRIGTKLVLERLEKDDVPRRNR